MPSIGLAPPQLGKNEGPAKGPFWSPLSWRTVNGNFHGLCGVQPFLKHLQLKADASRAKRESPQSGSPSGAVGMNYADIDVEAVIRAQRESFQESTRQAAAEAADPFGRHRWIRLQDLQTAALNGKYAEIIVPANQDSRFGVRVQGEKAAKLIKRVNLMPIPDDETVEVCRIAAKGEQGFVGGYIQDTRWPLAVLEGMPWTVSPMSVRLGFPLCLASGTSIPSARTSGL